jgi:Outer membrane protein beta-barrel domain
MRQSASMLVVLMLLPSAARGQPAPPPLPRVDVAAATGWFAADRSIRGDGCCSSWSSSLFKGLSGGYYWTEHLKTEVEFAAPGPTEGYTVLSEQVAVNRFRYISEEHRVSAGRVSLSQAYQFGHNSTFHPYVRAGVDVDREHDDIERRISTGNAFEEQHSVATATHVRPFAATGFKAYFNERAFFRGEARFTPNHDGINQMIWSAGIGIDLGGRQRATGAPADAVSKAPAAPVRAPEPVERWRDYAAHLKIGDRVDVATAGGRRLVADLAAVDGSGITVKPVGRIAEPTRRIPFDQVEGLALHTGPAPGTRVGATIAGAGTGVGVFITLLMITFALIGD